MSIMDVDFEDTEIANILCPICRTPIQPGKINMCAKCLNNQIDISEGISKELVLFQCRSCERLLQTQSRWIHAAPESPELMQLCLKKIRGMSRVKLVDASFVWTEPHSKRVILRLTIQAEVYGSTIVQKEFNVTFVLTNQQCTDCQASYTHHTWVANVQVRQKVDHKRTFLFLEQLILKHNMTSACLGITEERDGIDFYFGHKGAADHFISFLRSVVPVEVKQSKRLVSQDFKSNTSKYKYTVAAHLASVCRNDLIILPKKLLHKAGGRSPLMLCHHVTNHLYFLQIDTLHTVELDAAAYFKCNGGFSPIASSRDLTNFWVISVRQLGVSHGKFRLAEVEVMREDDISSDGQIYTVVTHLGGLLRDGDTVAGYHLDVLQINADTRHLRKFAFPPVVLVKKTYQKRKRRRWKLRSMVKERGFVSDKYALTRQAQDQEAFMQELEEDLELRCRIDLFKDEASVSESMLSGSGAPGEEFAPTVPEEELIVGLDRMDLNVAPGESRPPIDSANGSAIGGMPVGSVDPTDDVEMT